ncbi:MAG: hypothetical protein H6738_03890 [Alphaproteobacteria bacterium]|nr:hypothetical protein [Alphaproteobacteria bacterium]MCB9695911.1 hypothetical protein [Alphaproteobacteria bacterium]
MGLRAIPGPIRARGGVQLVEPDRLRGRNLEPGAEVALTADGRLLIRMAGGFLTQARLVEIARAELTVTRQESGFVLAGGLVTELVIGAAPGSSMYAVLAWMAEGGDPSEAWGPGPGFRQVGVVHAVRLSLDPSDARKPHRGQVLGRARSTTLLWTNDAGDVVLDDPHDPVRLSASEVLAVSRPEGGAVLHLLRPESEGWVTGVRLHGELELVARGVPPGPILPASVAGTAARRGVSAALLVRYGEAVALLGADGEEQARIEGFRWAVLDRLLVAGDGVALTGDVPADRAAWVLGGEPDPTLLDGGPDGPVRAEVEGEQLVVRGLRERRVLLSAIDPERVRVEHDAGRMTLEVGGVWLRGAPGALAGLRERIVGGGGGAALEQASLAELYRTWHQLRTERWLWWIYGPVVLTDHQLERAGDLPREPNEEEERWVRRRVITETLIVASQVRSVRLRMGAAPPALPYALIEEEAAWLDELTGGKGAGALLASRSELLDGFRMHLRATLGHLGFALADVERAVARLEPVHHPELRGGTPSVWGRVGLGAAMMLLSPISGAITIGHAVVSRFTDDLAKDGGATVLVDRFGPECRTSWALLLDVSALAMVETHNHLSQLWRKLAARDRALLGEGNEEQARPALIRRIQALRAERAVVLEGLDGETVGDVSRRMGNAMRAGPRQLVERLTARGAGGVLTSADPG